MVCHVSDIPKLRAERFFDRKRAVRASILSSESAALARFRSSTNIRLNVQLHGTNFTRVHLAHLEHAPINSRLPGSAARFLTRCATRSSIFSLFPRDFSSRTRRASLNLYRNNASRHVASRF